jgi:hypothetical protein
MTENSDEQLGLEDLAGGRVEDVDAIAVVDFNPRAGLKDSMHRGSALGKAFFILFPESWILDGHPPVLNLLTPKNLQADS